MNNNLTMKNLTLVFSFLLTFGAMTAQNSLKEGFFQFEITEVTSDDEQTQAMLQMMKGSTVDVYFKKEKQRVDLDMMGGMMKMSTFPGQAGDRPNILYMDMMGRKIKVPMDEKELNKFQQKGGAEDVGEAKVEKVAGQGKNILGFACEKVIITYTGQPDMKMTAYVTDAINSPASVIQNTGSDLDLGGFPMMYTINHPQMTMTYEAVKHEKSVEAARFEMPEGYDEMNFEEFVQSMGAMTGMGQ